MNEEWLFVSGPGRSGTTLVEGLLNLHPDCVVLHEALFLDRAYRVAFEKQSEVTVPHFNPNDMEGSEPKPPMIQWNPDGTLLSRRTDEARLGLVRALCQFVRAHWPHARVFGDKHPWLVNQWQEIFEVFPGAKLVVCERDPDEIMASQLRKFGLHSEHVRTMDEIVETLANGRVAHAEAGAHVMKLEKLNERPGVEIGKLLDYAGLETKQYPMGRAVHQVVHGKDVEVLVAW